MSNFDDGSAQQRSLTDLLSYPKMINRNGNPLVLDISQKRVSGHSFPSRKLNTLGVTGLSAIGQHPPHRLQASLSGFLSGASLRFGMLPDVTLETSKCEANEELLKADHKRMKMSVPSSSSVLNGDSVLVQRLSSMSGGFPMPKWGGIKKVPKARVAHTPTKRIWPKHCAFPMPPLNKGATKHMANISLESFRKLWQQNDSDLRKEVLARKLQGGKQVERRR